MYILVAPEEPSQSLAFIPQAPVDLNSNKFFCDLCKVGAPSQSQIDMHLNGKNHKVCGSFAINLNLLINFQLLVKNEEKHGWCF